MSWRKLIAILAAIGICFVTAEAVFAHRSVPPEAAQTLEGWLAWQPEANQFFVAEDGAHLMAIGREGGLLRSGPAVYVFDIQARLADWTRDLGDDPDFAREWLIHYPLPLVDRVQAQAWASKSPKR